jgi:hypothetical protein
MNSLEITEKFHEQFYHMKTMKTKYRLRIDNNNNLFVNTDKHNYISYKRKLHIFFAQFIPKYYLFLEKFFSELINSSNDENKIIAIKNINLISIIHYGFNILKSKYQFRHNKDRYTKFLILIGMFEIILFKTKLQYIKQFCTKGDSYTITCSCDFCNSLEKII